MIPKCRTLQWYPSQAQFTGTGSVVLLVAEAGAVEAVVGSVVESTLGLALGGGGRSTDATAHHLADVGHDDIFVTLIPD